MSNKLRTFTINEYLNDYHVKFEGWDFSYITQTGRMVTEPLLWCYTSKLLPYLKGINSLLDIGTGGGEFLELLRPLPKETYATEMYQPNIPIAKERLERYGVYVKVPPDDHHLPFENNFFDVIIDKHESYSVGEIRRILKSEGCFITQQVGDKNFIDMNDLFEYKDPDDEPWNLKFACEQLEKEGFYIIYRNEDFPKTRFFDLGAILYYLNAIPWQIGDFTIENYRHILSLIFDQINEEGFIEFTEHRFIIIAKLETKFK